MALQGEFTRPLTIVASAVMLWMVASGVSAAEPIRLFEGATPEPVVPSGGQGRVLPPREGAQIELTTDISDPTLVPYLPDGNKPGRTAIIVLPGGGFRYITTDLEGSEACEWLAKLGVAAFLLKHRCPTHEHMNPAEGPAQDARQALRLVRKRAAEWLIDPAKVGLLGFSAGGQASLLATLHSDDSAPGSTASPSATSKPDFLMLAYPWGLYDPESKNLKPAFQPQAGMPPLFIAQAANDTASLPQGSTLLFLKALDLGIPAELHVYEAGGHGYGIRPASAPTSTAWPQQAELWLRHRGLVRTAAK